nr:MAG TPA: hypothetical protein [Caudoviricetes sp.]
MKIGRVYIYIYGVKYKLNFKILLYDNNETLTLLYLSSPL